MKLERFPYIPPPNREAEKPIGWGPTAPGDTHIAALGGSHVPPEGNVREPKVLPGWLISQMAEAAREAKAKRDELQEAAYRAQRRMKDAEKAASKMLAKAGFFRRSR